MVEWWVVGVVDWEDGSWVVVWEDGLWGWWIGKMVCGWWDEDGEFRGSGIERAQSTRSKLWRCSPTCAPREMEHDDQRSRGVAARPGRFLSTHGSQYLDQSGSLPALSPFGQQAYGALSKQ